MSADKYPSIFSRQKEAIVCIVARENHSIFNERISRIGNDNAEEKKC